MFKKLKIKLTLINLVLLSVVLIIVFSGIYTLMQSTIENQSLALMKNVARREHIVIQPPKRTSKPPDERSVLSNCFFIKTGFDNKILDVSSNISISAEDATALISDTIKKSTTSSTITYKDSSLKFIIVQKPYGYIFVFLDRNHDNNFLNWLILNYFIIGSISLLLVFAISLYLANKALVPIKNSWDKQRSFVSDASHELRTPLAVMNTSLEIVLDNQSETIESQSKWLENIQSEVKRMSKLVEDLLFLARSDTDAKNIDIRKFNLSNSLLDLVDFFQPFITVKGITLNPQIDKDIQFNGSENRMKQLVTILIDNAVQHTPVGGTIDLIMQSKDSLIKISVKDNGSGIPEEHLDKIFERFYKVDKARVGNDNGSGLGLSIAACIAKEHNGTLSVSSIVNQGSTFKLTLPKSRETL